ncbi:MAG TPA: ECF-type sigma factor [Planctomycetota bacterium]
MPRFLGREAEPSAEVAFERLYAELRQLAGFALRGREVGVVQPTGLVHEAWLKLQGHLEGIRDRRHFFAVAAMAMRQVLADQARAARAQRRDGERLTVSLDIAVAGRAAATAASSDLVALDNALTKLASLNERHANVVELRFLSGLTIEEVAHVLDVPPRTVASDWGMAQAWLRSELERS